MNKRILVVDDDEGILEAFEAILESSNYEVVTSLNADYIEKLVRDNIDLILLDVLLSGQDGRDICKRLKEDPKTKHIPIIMVSAHPSAKKTMKEAKADDFLEKPFDIEVLLEMIRKYIS